MAPKPVRGQTRRSAAALPQTQQAGFLLEAARSFAETAPQLAALLGRRALQAAEGEHGALPRGAAATLCSHCGAPLTADVMCRGGDVVKLPRKTVLRNLRRAAKCAPRPGQPSQQVNRAAALHVCGACSHTTVRQYYKRASAVASISKLNARPGELS